MSGGNALSSILPDWIEVLFVGVIVLAIVGDVVWSIVTECQNLFKSPEKNKMVTSPAKYGFQPVHR
jgi:hypothetical protein